MSANVKERVAAKSRHQFDRNKRKGPRAIVEQTPIRMDQQRGRIAAQRNAAKRGG